MRRSVGCLFRVTPVFLKEDPFKGLEKVDMPPSPMVDDVPVRNFPSSLEKKDEGAGSMAQYKRSTTDFVASTGKEMGFGFGAGFGIVSDKRFEAGHGAVKKVEEEPEEQIMSFEEAQKSPELKKKRLERAKKEAEKIVKRYSGTQTSNDDHFLLADLDYEKDSLLFGTDPMQFEDNVKKLKKVITEYNEWEKNDNYYIYATWFAKFVLAYCILESLHLERVKSSLATSLEGYLAVSNEEISNMNESFRRDCERVQKVFESHPPVFDEVLRAMAAAKEESSYSHPMDTRGDGIAAKEQEKHDAAQDFSKFFGGNRQEVKASVWNLLTTKPAVQKKEESLSDEEIKQYTYAASPTNVPAVRQARRFLLPRSDDFTQIVREEMADYYKKKESSLVHPAEKAA